MNDEIEETPAGVPSARSRKRTEILGAIVLSIPILAFVAYFVIDAMSGEVIARIDLGGLGQPAEQAIALEGGPVVLVLGARYSRDGTIEPTLDAVALREGEEVARTQCQLPWERGSFVGTSRWGRQVSGERCVLEVPEGTSSIRVEAGDATGHFHAEELWVEVEKD